MLFGGAAGGGKTDALVGDAIRHTQQRQGRVLYLRRTIPDLKRTIMPRFQSRLYGLAKWNGSDKTWIFPEKNSVIQFGSCQRLEDVNQYKSDEYSLIILDEATQFYEQQVEFLKTRNRSSAGIKCRMRYASNPGEVGHGYFKKKFIDGKKPKKIYVDQDKATYCFIPSKVEDNPIWAQPGQTYIQKLDALRHTDPKLYRALRLGDWDIFEGQFFTTWDPALHIVDPFPVPSSWRIYRTLDWGYGSFLCCHWWAVTPDMQHSYCIAEYYVTRVQSRDAAAEIRTIEKKIFDLGEHTPDRTYCTYVDPSIFSAGRGQTGKSIAEDFQDVWGDKSFIYPADNSRVPGWNVFRSMLSIQPDGLPRAMWFSSCKELIRTLPNMVHDKHKVEDLDTTLEDHAADADRYFFIMRFGPEAIEKPKPYADLATKDQGSYEEWEAVNKMFEKRKSPASAARNIQKVGE